MTLMMTRRVRDARKAWQDDALCLAVLNYLKRPNHKVRVRDGFEFLVPGSEHLGWFNFTEGDGVRRLAEQLAITPSEAETAEALERVNTPTPIKMVLEGWEVSNTKKRIIGSIPYPNGACDTATEAVMINSETGAKCYRSDLPVYITYLPWMFEGRIYSGSFAAWVWPDGKYDVCLNALRLASDPTTPVPEAEVDYLIDNMKLSGEAIARIALAATQNRSFRDCRKALGLTQTQLAQVMGYSGKAQISQIENGHERPSDMALRLLQAYLRGDRPEDWPVPRSQSSNLQNRNAKGIA